MTELTTVEQAQETIEHFNNWLGKGSPVAKLAQDYITVRKRCDEFNVWMKRDSVLSAVLAERDELRANFNAIKDELDRENI